MTLAPKDVNIGEVIRRYEDDMRLVECFDQKNNTCPIAGVCSLAGIIDEALEAFLIILDRRTLADILKSSPDMAQKLGVAGKVRRGDPQRRSCKRPISP